MLIIALDDEPLLLDDLIRAISEVEPEADVKGFSFPAEVIKAVEDDGLRPDVVFLDIELPGMSGLDLAKRIGDSAPDVNVIFVTGFSQYAVDAAGMYASGYIMKPVDPGRIRRELENLRHPLPQAPKRRLRAQTFGSFEVFADGKPLHFKYAKTKELLAYLIDRRGAAMNTCELCAVLWEDVYVQTTLKSHLRNLISDLTCALRSCGQQDAFVKSRNSFAVNTSAIDCDLYWFLQGDAYAVKDYRGEYMSQYPWAEMTLGELIER